MKKCLFVLLFAGLYISMFSQQAGQRYVDVANNNFIKEYEWEKLKARGHNKKLKCENSYLFHDFLEGKLFLKDGKNISFKLNYNLLYKEVEFINNTDTAFIKNRADVDSVSVFNRTFLYTMYNSGRKIETIFAEKLNNGNVTLFIAKMKVYVPGEEQSAYVPKSDPHFIDEEIYLLKLVNEPAVAVDSRSDIYKLYPDKKKEIKKFMKKNRVRFSNQQSLVKLANYLSSLA